MTPPPGYRLAVAPRFHLEPGWEARVRVGAGVEEVAGCFFPVGPWRPPTAAELAALVVAPGGDAAGLVALFRLPDHLREEWWDRLDPAGGVAAVRGFDEYAAVVRDFLRFKGLAPDGPDRVEAVVTAAGERSIRRDPGTGRPTGLGPTVAPWAPLPPPPGGAVPRLHAVVNLGDEPTGMVLLGLPDDPPGDQGLTTVGELVEWVFRATDKHPPVRVRLGPGEGLALPPDGLILDGDPSDKQDPDVLLLITATGAP